MLFESAGNALLLVNCYLCLMGNDPDQCITSCSQAQDVHKVSTKTDEKTAPKATTSDTFDIEECPPLDLAPDEPVSKITVEDLEKYHEQAEETLKEAKNLWKSPNWELYESDDLGDISSLQVESNKIWAFTMQVDIIPCLLIGHIFELLMNPTIAEEHLVLKISPLMGISHFIAPPYPGNIGPRDFVDLYKTTKEGGTYLFSFSNIDGVVPETEDYVRAENRESAIIIEPVNDGDSQVTWIINNDYKLYPFLRNLAQYQIPGNLRKIMFHVQEVVKSVTSVN